MGKETEDRWTKYGKKNLVGKKVVEVRYLTQAEADIMGWYSRPIVIIFDDGSAIYPSKDDEGNNGGALFGIDKKGKQLTFPVI